MKPRLPFSFAGLDQALAPSRFLVFASLLVVLAGSATCAAEGKEAAAAGRRTLGVLVFPGMEMLDFAGPVELWGNLSKEVTLVTVATEAGPVKTAQGVAVVADHGYADCPALDLLLVPGGVGAFTLLKDPASLAFVRERAATAEITMSVCNGASVLAAAGLLDGRPATTNNQFWKASTAPGPQVKWVRKARWVDDGDRVTSSGVSAGMDMTLHVIGRLYGIRRAERLAEIIEYEWHRDANRDPFAKDEG